MTYQSNRLLTLLTSYPESLNNVAKAYDATGSAQAKFNIYLESNEAKMNKLKSTMDALFIETLNSEAIGKVLILATAFIQFANDTDLLTVALGGLIGYGLQALLPAIVGLIVPMGALAGETVVATGAFARLNAVMLANPYVLVGTLIAGLVVWLNKQKTATEEVIDASNKNIQNMQSEKTKADELSKSIEELTKKQGRTLEESQKLALAKEELIKIYPELKSVIESETTKQGELATAIATVTARRIEDSKQALKQQRYDLALKRAKTQLTTQGIESRAKGAIDAGSISSFEGEINANKSVISSYQKEIDAIDAQLKSMDSIKNEIIIGGVKTSPDSKMSGTQSGTKTVDEKKTKAKIDLLTDLEKQLLANAHATSILKSQQSLLEEDDPKRIDSLKQEIELYNKRQDLLHQQADATRKEISTIKSKKKLTDQDKKNIEELEANLKSYGEEWWNLENAIANVGVESEKTYDAIIKKQEEASKKNLESINNLKDSIKSMIEQEYKDKIELEKKSVENAKDELDLRLKQLETEKDLADFLAGKADKEKDINKINDKIISLQTASNQGDMRARAELIKLEEERAKTQIELDKYITDETFKNKKEALQNEYDIFEDASDDRVEGYEQELKEVGTIAKRINDELNAYLSGTNTSLYSELIAWNSKYGTGMDSDIISKWRTAIDLLIEYNKLQGGSPNVAGYERQTVIERMKMRGAQWASSSPERRAELNLANIEDAKSIGATYNPGTGQYIDASGAKIYDKGGLKPIGQVGVMAENVKEWVLKDNNIIDLAKIGVGQFLKTLSPTNIPLFNSSSQSAPNVNIVINGAVNDSNIQRINNNIKETILSVSQGQLDSFRSRGLKPATRTR